MIGSGITASFWHDSWTEVGPLIELLGPDGPRTTGLQLKASVAEGLRNGDWWINSSRSRNPLITLLKQCLPPAAPIYQAECDDRYGWKVGNRAPVHKFPTADTSSHLFPPGLEIPWLRQVWFTDHIPKHAFFTWVNVRHRLATRDRMRQWGLDVPATCVICATSDESREHLFFQCPFSSSVWHHFITRVNLHPRQSFDAILAWLARPSADHHIALICRLFYQVSMYYIWKERNARIHSTTTKTPTALISEIQHTIKLRLDPLSRTTRLLSSSNTTPLGTWLSLF